MFNKIANTIAYFEELIKEYDYVTCSQENQAELAEKKEHLTVAIDTMNLVLSDPKMVLALHGGTANHE